MKCTYRIGRTFWFEAAALLDRTANQDKTNRIIGHVYQVEIVLAARCLDEYLTVLDQDCLRPLCEELREKLTGRVFLSETAAAKPIHATLPGACPMTAQPSGEMLALLILEDAAAFITALFERVGHGPANGVRIERVRVAESPDCWAEAIAQEA